MPVSQMTINNRRKIHRARRLRLHPWREHRSDKEAFLEKALEKSLHMLKEKSEPAKTDDGVKKLQEQMLQSRAELDNFRKRTQREKANMRKYAGQDLLDSLLPALDSLDHAVNALEQDHDTEALASGIAAIHQQFQQALEGQNFEVLNPVGENFDPNFHEAIGVEQTDEYPHNSVIQVLQKGYLLHDRLIRPARVRIAQKS